MGGILRESGGLTGMSGPLNSQQGLVQQQMQALRQPAPVHPHVELPNGGLGLLPKDLLTETVQADNVSERIKAAVTSYQESREQEMQPIQQSEWAGRWTFHVS